MIRYFIPFTLLCATLTFASCGDNEDNDIDVPTEEVVPGTNHNVLVAYFSEPLPDGVDASTSASRVIVNGDLYGSVEYMAMVISEATGADVVRIQTATPYPGNFDDLASQADNERQNRYADEDELADAGFDYVSDEEVDASYDDVDDDDEF